MTEHRFNLWIRTVAEAVQLILLAVFVIHVTEWHWFWAGTAAFGYQFVANMAAYARMKTTE